MYTIRISSILIENIESSCRICLVASIYNRINISSTIILEIQKAKSVKIFNSLNNA